MSEVEGLYCSRREAGSMPVKVLVADDHSSVRSMITEALETVGYSVASASDGQEALQVFRTFRPQIILMDVMMPGENGYRLSRMIKYLGRLGTIRPPRILLVTARRTDDSPEREEALLAFSMADGVLYKP